MHLLPILIVGKRIKSEDNKMENIINQIITTFRTYGSQILSDKNVKNLSNENFSDTVSDKSEGSVSVSKQAKTSNVIRENSIKYSTTDDDKVVVQVIRDESGKIIRTIPLNEQHVLDIFE